METGCDKVDLEHKEVLAVVEEDIQKITANIQVGPEPVTARGTLSESERLNSLIIGCLLAKVTNKELALFQQKLEEEVKKDQKEKKANQEVLRSLKVEIEQLVEEHGR